MVTNILIMVKIIEITRSDHSAINYINNIRVKENSAGQRAKSVLYYNNNDNNNNNNNY